MTERSTRPRRSGRSGRLTVMVVTAAIALWGAAAVLADEDAPTVLGPGTHLLAPRLESGALELGVASLPAGTTASTQPPTDAEWNPLGDVVLHLPPVGRISIQPNTPWEALLPAWSAAWWTGGPAGAVPELLIHAGLVPDDQRAEGALTSFTLTGATGPGHLFSTTFLNLNAINTTDGVAGDTVTTTTFSNLVNARWVFAAEGFYCLDLTAEVELVGGTTAAGRGQLAVAVGDVDPRSAPQCEPLPPGTTPDPDPAPAPAVKVVSSWRHGLRPFWVPAEEPGEPDELVFGLLHQFSASGYSATQGWSPIDDVVLHIGSHLETTVPDVYGWADFGPPWAPLWQTPSSYVDGPVFLTNLASIPAEQRHGSNPTFTLWAATGPGHVMIGSDGKSAHVINTSRGLPASIQGFWGGRSDQVWSFSRQGVYCLDFEVSMTANDGTRYSDRRPVTVLVGDGDPTAVTPCSGLPDGTVPDPEPVDHGPGPDPEPNVGVLPSEHTDFSPRLDAAGEYTIGLFENHGSVEQWHDMEETIVHIPEIASTVLAEPNDFWDPSFIAEPGSTVWEIPETQQQGVAWLGLSTDPVWIGDFQRHITLGILGVAGIDGGAPPGDFVMWNGNVGKGGRPIFSTREGVPAAIPMPTGHSHQYWTFTAKGIYCVNFESKAIRHDGLPLEDRRVMTVVVGDDIDPATVTSCRDLGVIPLRTHVREPVEAAPGVSLITPAPVVLGEPQPRLRYTSLVPTVDDGGIEVRLVEGTQIDGGIAYDPESVIFQGRARTVGQTTVSATRVPWHADSGGRYWAVTPDPSGNGIPLTWDMSKIGEDELDGGLTWRLVEVDGPGDLVVYDNYSQHVARAIFSNRSGYQRDEITLDSGEAVHPTWTFSEAGRYCVALEWSGTLSDGKAASLMQTLTLVAGDIDGASVEPCVEPSQEPPDTSDPDPDPDPGDPKDPSDPKDPGGPDDPDPGEVIPVVFGDVGADHLFATEIGWLGGMGITRGCNPPANDRFCPSDQVTRGQMAAFLVRALGLPAGDATFTDTTDSVFTGDIAALAEAGITRGCNPPANDRFCPSDPVTRGQMAAFLLRALELSPGSAVFEDTTDSVFAGDIAALAEAGITRGCNPPANDRFCPSDPVTRGQMAAFLYRALP